MREKSIELLVIFDTPIGQTHDVPVNTSAIFVPGAFAVSAFANGNAPFIVRRRPDWRRHSTNPGEDPRDRPYLLHKLTVVAEGRLFDLVEAPARTTNATHEDRQ